MNLWKDKPGKVGRWRSSDVVLMDAYDYIEYKSDKYYALRDFSNNIIYIVSGEWVYGELSADGDVTEYEVRKKVVLPDKKKEKPKKKENRGKRAEVSIYDDAGEIDFNVLMSGVNEFLKTLDQ